MRERHYIMIKQLREFKQAYTEYKQTGDSLEAELLYNNRLIKKEVIDVAQLTESVSTTLILLNRKIDRQFEDLNKRLDTIQALIRKRSEEETEASAAHKDTIGVNRTPGGSFL